MKPDRPKSGRALPFDDDAGVDWESELDAWDAALPIPVGEPPAAGAPPDAPPPPAESALVIDVFEPEPRALPDDAPLRSPPPPQHGHLPPAHEIADAETREMFAGSGGEASESFEIATRIAGEVDFVESLATRIADAGVSGDGATQVIDQEVQQRLAQSSELSEEALEISAEPITALSRDSEAMARIMRGSARGIPALPDVGVEVLPVGARPEPVAQASSDLLVIPDLSELEQAASSPLPPPGFALDGDDADDDADTRLTQPYDDSYASVEIEDTPPIPGSLPGVAMDGDITASGGTGPAEARREPDDLPELPAAVTARHAAAQVAVAPPIPEPAAARRSRPPAVPGGAPAAPTPGPEPIVDDLGDVFDVVPPPDLATSTPPPMAVRDEAAPAPDLTDGLRLPEEAPAVVRDRAYWRDQLAILKAELGCWQAAGDRDRAVRLAVAAGGVAERCLGDPDGALRLYDEAIALDARDLPALRGRLRLLEGRSDRRVVGPALDALAAASGAEERAIYRALAAEWILAQGQALDEERLAALPAGAARAFAQAESALGAGSMERVGDALEEAGLAVGGETGAALIAAAARFDEISGDSPAAAGRLLAAKRLHASLPALAMAALRNAARLDGAGALRELEEALRVLPDSPVKAGVARWAARTALRDGNPTRASKLLSDAAAWAPWSRPLIRDRLDLLTDADGPNAEGLLAQASRLWESPEDRAVLALRAALLLASSGEARAGEAALSTLSVALGALPSAVPLALAAEEAGRAMAAASRSDTAVKAHELWAKHDPGRRGFAALTMARLGQPSSGLQRWALGTPADPSFWSHAYRELAAGRPAEAAAALEAGAAAWQDSPLAAYLQERAAEIRGGVDAAQAVANLRPLASAAASPAAAASVSAVSWTLQRFLARPGGGDPDALRVHYAEQAEATRDPERKAALLLRRAMTVDASNGGQVDIAAAVNATVEARASLGGALDAVPGHAAALALYAVQAAVEREKVAARLAAAAGAAGSSGPGAAQRRIEAAGWLAQAGDAAGALALAAEALNVEPHSRACRGLVLRLARQAGDAARRAEILEQVRENARGGPASAGLDLEWAEAIEQRGDPAQAAVVYQSLATGDGVIAAEAHLGLIRCLWASGDGGALADFYRARAQALAEQGAVGAASPSDAAPAASAAAVRAFIDQARVESDLLADTEASRAAFSDALAADPQHPEAGLARFLAAARRGRYDEAADMVESMAGIVKDGVAAAQVLVLAGLLDEGRAGGAHAGRLVVAAVERDAASVAAARWRVDLELGRDPRSPEAASALAALAAMVSTDTRTAAALLTRAAEIYAARNDAPTAEARFREATGHDPACLAAIIPLRRALMRRGAWAEAAAAYAMESNALVHPAHRATALLVAGVIAQDHLHDDARAADLLRQVLAIESASQEAFNRLQRILETKKDFAALGRLLASRIAEVAGTGEEVVLRLARADLLAAAGGDRAGAKAELTALLRRNPQQPRALERLADLEYGDGAYGPAAELYIKRARIETEADVLRDIFLRLGRIYTAHLPDPKRAIVSFSRVLQIEPDNREALEALSGLYTQEGDARNAAQVTSRLVDAETEPDKRVPFLVRLARIAEAAGDVRQAGAVLQRTVQEAPRNPDAVGELTRFFERTKDLQSRRVFLDRSLGLLRDDLRRNPVDLSVLRAIVPILRWRGAPASAAAAAQLLSALSDVPAEREAAAGWAAPPRYGRRLTALANPDLDDRAFPAALPGGLRNVFRLVGDAISKASRVDLKQRYGVGKGDRLSRGQPPRDVLDPIAGELGVREYDVYAIMAEPAALVVEPGDPPSIILGARVMALGAAATRFVGARALRVIASHLDAPARATIAELGVMLAGVVRQFVPDYVHPDVDPRAAAAETARMSKAIPRALKPQVAPFAVECTAHVNLHEAHAALREAANRVGLLACGDLPASLAVILAAAGKQFSAESLRANPEALALLRFALSDDHDDLCRALD